MTYKLKKGGFEKFKEHLRKLGFNFEERPHQVFLAKYSNFSVNLYNSGKITFGGKDEQLQREVEWYLRELGGQSITEGPSDFQGLNRIGSDEAGKGDFFGPLVITGVFIDSDTEEELIAIGVKDSKKIRSDKRIMEISNHIRELLGKENHETVQINPPRYNELYNKLRNLNSILGWAHARVIENLLSRNSDCEVAIADQFGDQKYINQALMTKGKHIELIQMHKGERDLAVATASILARDRFLKSMKKLNDSYDMVFPRGSGKVDEALSAFTRNHGKDSLYKVAKLHFSMARRIYQ